MSPSVEFVLKPLELRVEHICFRLPLARSQEVTASSPDDPESRGVPGSEPLLANRVQ